MGDIVNNDMAVIDNKLLVRNTINLRIVDASIYPHLTSGNIYYYYHIFYQLFILVHI